MISEGEQRGLFTAALQAGEAAGFDLVSVVVVDGLAEYQWRTEAYGQRHGIVQTVSERQLNGLEDFNAFKRHWRDYCAARMAARLKNYREAHGYD